MVAQVVAVGIAVLQFEAGARLTEAALATSFWAKTVWPQPKAAVSEIGASEAAAVEWAVVIAKIRNVFQLSTYLVIVK